MKMLVKLTVLAVAVASVAACERTRAAIGQEGYVQDGIRFKPRVQADKEDRANFVVTVRGVSRSPKGAQEAARVGGTRHCITYYGNSDITWMGASPDDEEVALDRGDLTLSGRCSTW